MIQTIKKNFYTRKLNSLDGHFISFEDNNVVSFYLDGVKRRISADEIMSAVLKTDLIKKSYIYSKPTTREVLEKYARL